VRRARAAASALAACALSAACARPDTEGLPNLVLLSLDTLRADHLSCYGYPVATSPELDAFAERATRYTRARSTAPWTLPAHASMFTGLLPFEHGAHGEKVDDLRNNARPLSGDAVTIAELLSSVGYRTQAFVTNEVFLAPHYELGQGFDSWFVRPGRSGDLHERAVLPWLRRAEPPFFLFVNYMDTHRPYASNEREGLLPRPVGRDSGALLDKLYTPVLSGAGRRDAPAMQRLVDQYDTAIANLDEELGRLFDELEALGLFEDALVIVTSDHGEYFGEHDLIEHSKDVYEGALAVPLIVKHPGQRHGGIVDEPTSIASVPRLLLEALPEERRAELAARLPREAPGRPVVAENYYSRARELVGQPWGDRFRRVRRVLYEGDWKYVEGTDGTRELYDLAADPAEERDRAADEPERLAELRARLEAVLGAPRARFVTSAVRDWSPEERSALKDLGYF